MLVEILNNEQRFPNNDFFLPMFKSLEYFIGQKVDIDQILLDLTHYGYRKSKMVHAEGDFAQRGSVVDIFPSNFEI